MEKKPLWAPWRMEYVGAAKKKTSGCLFCRVLREGPARAGANLVVAFRPGAFIMMNRYPYINGHVMVVPEKHASRLRDYTDGQVADLFEAVRLSEEMLCACLRCEGLNIGLNLGRAAGAGIADHLHVHLVPRWAGDTNYMTILGDVRTIPQHIRRTHAILREWMRPARLDIPRNRRNTGHRH